MILKFMLIGIIGVALEFVVAYFILYIKKVECTLNLIVNNIAITYLPVIVGLVINLVVGNFYAPITLGVYIACSIIHLVFLYKGIQSMLASGIEPIGEYSIFIVIVSIILSIMLFNTIDSSIGMAFDALESYLQSMTSDLLDSFKW